MATLVHLDTHVLVLLYAQGRDGLSPLAVRAIEQADQLRISPMVRLELEYLYEIGRLTRPAAELINTLTVHLPLVTCEQSFAVVVTAAQEERWTRDPFDRLIVAQARCAEAVLLSRDRRIHAHYPKTMW